MYKFQKKTTTSQDEKFDLRWKEGRRMKKPISLCSFLVLLIFFALFYFFILFFAREQKKQPQKIEGDETGEREME